MKTFYQMSGEDTMKQLNGSAEPLTESQVKEHQEKYGRNELVEGKKKTVLQIFLEQYKDFLVIILIIAAIASGFMGDVESTAVILIVITMNAILGTVQTVLRMEERYQLSQTILLFLRDIRNSDDIFYTLSVLHDLLL